MKHIKTFKPTWFFGAMLMAVVIAELVANALRQFVEVPISPVGVGALAIGLVTFATSVLYDGN